MNYKYDTPEEAYSTPEEAYRKAQHLIEKVKDKSATELDLAGWGLTAIPPEIAQLTKLERLNLYNNKLTTFPPELNQLMNLTHLWFSNNQLTIIPADIVRLINLRYLWLNDNQLAIFPTELNQLLNLITLDLNGNQLTDVSPEIALLTNLQTIRLGFNKLTDFPLKITELTQLKRLDLNDNQLTIILPGIAQLANLEWLELQNNQLSNVSPEIAHLTNLKRFYLDNNPDLPIPPEIVEQYNNPQVILAYLRALDLIEKAKDASSTKLDLKGIGLTVVPHEIAQLTNLQVLFLNDNKLIAPPPGITKLSDLRELSLSGNQLTSFPLEITQLSNLIALYLYDNQLTEIPSEIAKLTNLQMLNLSVNQLTNIPLEIAQLIKLEELLLYENKLVAIPSEISQLKNLKRLYLNYNKIIDIPSEIGQLTNLIRLGLNGNQLIDIPSEIGQMKNLKRLYLNENKLIEIPAEFAKLINLELLNLSDNDLTTIPPEIVQLTNLQFLLLKNNQLTGDPSQLSKLTNLEVLDLRNNSDLPIPPEIIDQWENAQAILDYLREQQTQPLNEAKLIFVGQGSVGKTSLVNSLLGKAFNEHEDQTKGICIDQWKLAVNQSVQGRVPTITLNIWDFGGQEIMHATHQFFLTERSLYLLVIDARQGEDEGQLEYWLSLINSFAADAPVLIVINKIDQQRLDINRRGLQQKYPAIKGFVSTSARTEEGIDQLKTEIAAILAEMPHIDTPFPASWQRLKEELTAMQSTRHFLTYQEYETVCLECGVKEESAQRTLVRFLHDLGVVLNFQDDPRVRETNVLNPHWVTDGVYTLLNSPELQKQHGILRRDQLDVILPAEKYPPSQHRFLLDMMRKFELAYEMDWHSLLIPDLLAKEEPDFDWNNDESLQFAYQYQVLPRSILHRFMVRQYHLVDSEIRWRTGVMLRYDGLSALVKADIKSATIRIAIDGDGDRRQFLYSLRLSFAGIHETITGIQPKEVVPIPGHPQAPPLLYSYLEKLEAMNMPDEQLFPGMDEIFSVKQLLNGVSTSAMRQSGLPSRTQILDALRTYFDKSDFYELLFALDIDRDKLAGESVDDQKRECVLYMERNGRLAKLVEAMRKERPNLDFRTR